MYLIVSSTELEISALKSNKQLAQDCVFLTAGVGILESAISLTQFLSRSENDAHQTLLEGVIAFGVCGAYQTTGANILDICIAEKEHFGDFGVAIDSEIEYFTEDNLKNRCTFNLANDLSARIKNSLYDLRIKYKSGNFVTVQACTGTLSRGSFLQNKFNAICENMEGAALARVCELYGIPMAELRCVSNMVEDRDKSKWKIKEAVAKGSDVLVQLLAQLIKGGC